MDKIKVYKNYIFESQLRFTWTQDFRQRGKRKKNNLLYFYLKDSKYILVQNQIENRKDQYKSS